MYVNMMPVICIVIPMLETQLEIQGIISGQIQVPVTYENPDQTPLKGFEAQVLRFKWSESMDYLPHEPIISYLSDWLMNLYLGNYDYFMKQVEGLSKEQLKKKLNQ